MPSCERNDRRVIGISSRALFDIGGKQDIRDFPGRGQGGSGAKSTSNYRCISENSSISPAAVMPMLSHRNYSLASVIVVQAFRVDRRPDRQSCQHSGDMDQVTDQDVSQSALRIDTAAKT